MTRFVKVQAAGSYADYEVPTKEEYEDFQQNIGKQLDKLESIIEALSPRTPAGEEEPEKGTDVYKASLFSVAHGELELSGTEEQHKIFEKSREQTDKILFPKFLTHDKLVLLALDCGLSVKKIKRGK